MRRLAIAALLLMLTTAHVGAEEAAPLRILPEPVSILPPLIIKNDNGGFMSEYAEQVRSHYFSSQRVIIKGVCASACTLYLFLPKTCVDRKAKLMFHATSDSVTGRIDQTSTDMMVKLYPLKLRQWVIAKGGLSKKWLTLKGKEMHELVNICP